MAKRKPNFKCMYLIDKRLYNHLVDNSNTSSDIYANRSSLRNYITTPDIHNNATTNLTVAAPLHSTENISQNPLTVATPSHSTENISQNPLIDKNVSQAPKVDVQYPKFVTSDVLQSENRAQPIDVNIEPKPVPEVQPTEAEQIMDTERKKEIATDSAGLWITPGDRKKRVLEKWRRQNEERKKKGKSKIKKVNKISSFDQEKELTEDIEKKQVQPSKAEYPMDIGPKDSLDDNLISKDTLRKTGRKRRKKKSKSVNKPWTEHFKNIQKENNADKKKKRNIQTDVYMRDVGSDYEEEKRIQLDRNSESITTPTTYDIEKQRQIEYEAPKPVNYDERKAIGYEDPKPVNYVERKLVSFKAPKGLTYRRPKALTHDKRLTLKHTRGPVSDPYPLLDPFADQSVTQIHPSDRFRAYEIQVPLEYQGATRSLDYQDSKPLEYQGAVHSLDYERPLPVEREEQLAIQYVPEYETYPPGSVVKHTPHNTVSYNDLS